MTAPTRRLRTVPPLPGQLSLDLPGLPPPAELPAPAPRRRRLAAPGESENELPHMIVSRSDSNLNTLTTGVASLTTGQLGSGNRFPLKLAAALVMTIPVAIVYLVFQRKLVRGANSGSGKG